MNAVFLLVLLFAPADSGIYTGVRPRPPGIVASSEDKAECKRGDRRAECRRTVLVSTQGATRTQ